MLLLKLKPDSLMLGTLPNVLSRTQVYTHLTSMISLIPNVYLIPNVVFVKNLLTRITTTFTILWTQFKKEITLNFY